MAFAGPCFAKLRSFRNLNLFLKGFPYSNRFLVAQDNVLTSGCLYSRNASRRGTFKASQRPTSDVEKCDDSKENFMSPLSQTTALQAFNAPMTNVDSYVSNNKLIAKLSRSAAWCKKHRKKSNTMLVEGSSLIETCIQNGVEVEGIFYSRDNVISSFESDPVLAAKLHSVSDKLLRSLTKTLESPKIVAVCKRPAIDLESLPEANTIVLCSDIRDPYNMGLIIKAVASAGCKLLLLTTGCVNVWEHKVLKYAEGAHFGTRIISDLGWEDVTKYLPSNPHFFVADNKDDIELDDWQVVDSDGQSVKIDPNMTPRIVEEGLTCKLYCNFDYRQKNVVLYVGGETEGVNEEVVKLARTYGGYKVKIPLENGMDSLNVSSALSILLYEVRRQNLASE